MVKSRGKRKVLSGIPLQGDGDTKRSRVTNDVYKEDKLLCDLMNKAGLTLMNGEEPNQLNVSKAVFQKQLGTAIKRHVGDLLQTVEEFLGDFKEYIKDTQRFHKCLHPCVFSQSCESVQASAPDSTIRLLLGVDVIQSPLMSLLLNKLKEFMGNSEDHMKYQGQRIFVPRLLLSQFRFLDRIVDGKELSLSLQGVLSASSVDVQKEMMACVPDIVEDSEHEEVAHTLRQELVKNRDLTCPVIDALTYLNISQDAIIEVHGSILEMLKSFRIPDLPIVIKFLLESVTPKDAYEVVNEIRCGVCLTRKTTLKSEELERTRTGLKLVVDAIRGRMQFHPFVAEAWIKAMDASDQLYDLDLLVLLVLHSINHRKGVESLVRNKIRSGVLTHDWVAQVFKCHSHVLREYLFPILKVAQALLRSIETPIGMIGSCLYKLTFVAFDAYSRQEVVSNLITHIGSGIAIEIDASLQVLDDLVKDQLKAMSRFAVFLKGVLDYLDHNNLTVGQIRTLYFLLARLAFHTQEEGSFLQNELHIIVRKQLTSSNPRYKRMGVMGAISLVSALASNAGTSDNSSITSSNVSSQERDKNAMDKERYKEVISLMTLVQTSIHRDPEMCGLFLDGLAGMVTGLHPDIKDWLCDHMTSMFEDNFVAESPSGSDNPWQSQYNLNDEEESSIVLNLYPLMEKMMDKSQNQDLGMTSPLCLSPLFRLVTVCQSEVSEGTLEEIDALLGCPVFMPKADTIQGIQACSQKEKDGVCNSLFLCVNWFREILNSFGAVDTVEMKGKVLQRLKNVTELMSSLKKCLSANPSFLPPPCRFDIDQTPPSTLSSTKSKTSNDGKKKGGKGGKKSGKKKSSSILSESSQIEDEENSSVQQSGISQTRKEDRVEEESYINMTDYRQYFRELDFSVFNILKTGHISRKELDSDLNTKATEDLKIELPHLQYLLEDLSSKLSHFLTSTSYRRTFFKSKSGNTDRFSNLHRFSPTQIAKKTVELLPYLCDHLEGTCAFFQMQMDKNDGLRDGHNQNTEEARLTAACYQHLLHCVVSLFSWNGFASATNQNVLTDGLMVVVKRIQPMQDVNSSLSQTDSLKCTFRYFANFGDTIPNLDSAVCLIKLLNVLVDKQGTDGSLKQELGSVASNFMSVEWRGENGEKPKGIKHNENLQTLLRCVISCSEEPLEVLENFVTKGMLEIVRGNQCQEFPSLTRVTFPIFFKIVLQELVSCVKHIPMARKKDTDELNEDKMLTWSLSVKVLHLSTSLIKVIHTRSCLGTVLKCGRQFIEIFLKTGMPLMDTMFRKHHATVERLLKTLQQSTRTMHHLCGHSKIVKDVSLTNQVPMLKRALEAFVYRVKAMLMVNNCQDAFWMGNLKNKNLQGEEILSQTQSQDDDNDDDKDDEEEDSVDDDDNSDVEIDKESDETTQNKTNTGSYSEVF